MFIEYAKAAPEDILMRITACNRGPEEACIHVLPQLWFRNAWSWGYNPEKPALCAISDMELVAQHITFGEYHFYAGDSSSLIFCDDETNTLCLFNSTNGAHSYKDAFHDAVVHGNAGALNGSGTGTKTAAHYQFVIPAREERTVRVRLCRN